MKTPVFDDGRRILGWLEHDDSFRRERHFAIRCKPEPGPWKTLADWIPHDVFHNRRDEKHLLPQVQTVQFEWGTVGYSPDRHTAYYCDVLITRNVDGLNRIPGFLWFAEVHGKKVEFKQAAS